jgi:uncharacterized phage-associated protein
MYTKVMQSKIGNLLNLLSVRTSRLSMTKALKLLYLIDESAVIRFGVPVTWLDYQVWEKGPVAKEIWSEIRENPQHGFLKNYIDIKREPNTFNPNIDENIYLTTSKLFDIDEFSDNELEIIEEVLSQYGSKNTEQLVTKLHEETGLWYKSYIKNNLKNRFENRSKMSEIKLDFKELIRENSIKISAYEAAMEALVFQEQILSNRAQKTHILQNATY